MIDTKKYEGHTPAPWKVVSSPEHIHAKRIFHNNTYIGSVSNSDKSMKEMEPDACLIADAPMLLESLITAEARIKELEEALESVEHQVHSHRTWRGQYYEQNAIVPPFATKIANTARAALKGKA